MFLRLEKPFLGVSSPGASPIKFFSKKVLLVVGFGGMLPVSHLLLTALLSGSNDEASKELPCVVDEEEGLYVCETSSGSSFGVDGPRPSLL